MEIFGYAKKKRDAIYHELKTNPKKGLEKKDIAKYIEKYGYNRLDGGKLNAFKIFLRQFKSAFIYLLLAAMVITWFLEEPIDTAMIFIFLAVNTLLGFYQEFRSEKTVYFLKKYAVPRVKVLRSAKLEVILSEELVPGDILVLETGDKIPADVRFIEIQNLIVDESILTGESVPVAKKVIALKKEASSYYEATNLGFSGTNVLNGKAKAVVLATGKNSSFGKIANLTLKSKKVSDFEKGIDRFANFILKMVGLTILLVLLANLFVKRDGLNFIELVVFFIALTVSVIPEALPLVTTFSLSGGARKLAKKKVIVKRLSAVEDLGGVEVLFTDKTGTLTKNELKVANIFSDFSDQALVAANLAAPFEQRMKIEPFDIALWRELSSETKKEIRRNAEKIKEEPFNPSRKRNIALIKKGENLEIITRGAPEAVLEICSGLKDADIKNIKDWIKREGGQGHRVIAVARKGKKKCEVGDCILEKEKDFKFIGVISFVDTLKTDTVQAIKKAKSLGVGVKIITGDSLEVAGAVACEIGLIDSPEKVISGTDWEKLSRENKIKSIDENSVFARVSPEQKYAIIELAREKYSTGFLGEGINDAPALKICGVSLVVDSASEIAREAADIVLLEKNLNVIFHGIEEGRRVFANTNKYIKSTLISNFGNFFAVATVSLIIDYLPMLPIQILLVNLLSDTPLISVASDCVDKDELKAPKKYEIREIILFSILLGFVSTVFDFIFFGLFYKISPQVLQTNWFIGSILTEIVLIFSIRTKKVFFRAKPPSMVLGLLSVFVVIVTVALPFSYFGQEFFRFVPPTPYHLALILSIVGIYFVLSEILKLAFYRNFNRNNFSK